MATKVSDIDVLYLNEKDVTELYKNNIGVTVKDIDFAHSPMTCFKEELEHLIRITPIVIYKQYKVIKSR